MFARLSAEKESADNYHAIEKAKSKRSEVTELYFFVITSKINLPRNLGSGLYFCMLVGNMQKQRLDTFVHMSLRKSGQLTTTLSKQKKE